MIMIMMDEEESDRGEEWRLLGAKDRLYWNCDCRIARGGDLVVMGWYDVSCSLC